MAADSDAKEFDCQVDYRLLRTHILCTRSPRWPIVAAESRSQLPSCLEILQLRDSWRLEDAPQEGR